ncbi:MAG TPA: alcohol dehydrogenase catalytic domain-containing protein [Acidimicrobiales bacterium]|nr:alcohol dehydrogenase catalytic domain-containing protein [Acidimicrobiales bacterium]
MGEPALPQTMPAAVYQGKGRLTVEDRPVPEPGPDQVLVEVGHCGVCGSDLHMIVEGWGAPGSIAGHEWSGTIRAVGAGVSQWAAGDVVVGGPSPRCGHCRRCLQGKPSQCENRSSMITEHSDGAFAGYILVDARALLRVPPGLAPRSAALAEPLAVALHGITRGKLEPGETVMVFGAGPIGALSIAALVAQGGHRVTVVEPNPGRQALAQKLGADEVLHPEVLECFPRWEPEKLSAHAVDVVLECSGKGVAVETGLHQLLRGGRLVLVGAGMDQPALDPNRVILNELEISGSFIYDADGFDRALALLASGALPTDVLIEAQDVGLDELPQAMAGLAGGSIAGKVMVVPRRAGDVVVA